MCDIVNVNQTLILGDVTVKPNFLSFSVTNAARKMMLAAFLSLCVSGTLTAATQPEITREQAQANINDAIKTIASIITTETSTYAPVITFISSMVAEKSATGRTDITTFAGYARLKMELGQLAIPQEARGHLIEAVDRIAAALNAIHSLDTNAQWSLPKTALWVAVVVCVALLITKYVSSRMKNRSSALSTTKEEQAAASGTAVSGSVVSLNGNPVQIGGDDQSESGNGAVKLGMATPPRESFVPGSELVLEGGAANGLNMPTYCTFGSPDWQGNHTQTDEEQRANRDEIRRQIAEQNAADEAAKLRVAGQ